MKGQEKHKQFAVKCYARFLTRKENTHEYTKRIQHTKRP